jgi:hypothetical protein
MEKQNCTVTRDIPIEDDKATEEKNLCNEDQDNLHA